MNASIPPEFEQFVHSKVESGLYHSTGDVLREALHLLAERDELQRSRMDAMDAFIQVAFDQAERGEFCDPDEVEAELEQIIADAERKHA